MAQEPLSNYNYNNQYQSSSYPEHQSTSSGYDHYGQGYDGSAIPRTLAPYPTTLPQSPTRESYARDIAYGSQHAQNQYGDPQQYHMASQYPQPAQQSQYQPLPSVSTFMSASGPIAGTTEQSRQPFDTTGQIQPPGLRPRLTTSLSEDEGSLCFQVDVDGICVARREDNHMINGTKLLNVVGMTRGRRDGILKAEKQKQVVKVGPMHLKGVWIPYERALALANQEKITEKLYPLFVHNIAALVYHLANPVRGAAVPAAVPAAFDQRADHQG